MKEYILTFILVSDSKWLFMCAYFTFSLPWSDLTPDGRWYFCTADKRTGMQVLHGYLTYTT